MQEQETTPTTQERAAALAKFLEIAADDVQEAEHGNNAFEAEGEEWLVLTDEEADEAARESIRESAWASRPEFLVAYVPEGLDAAALQALVGDRCEGANGAVLALIEAGSGFDRFAEDAIAADGRGYFLSGYDAAEQEEGNFYLYRTN